MRQLFQADRSGGFRAFALACLVIQLALPAPAHALSELKPADPTQEAPAADDAPDDEPFIIPPLTGPQTGPDGGLPDPGPIIRQGSGDKTSEDAATEAPDAAEPAEPLPEIITDIAELPEPVARMRNLIIEAAKTGDPEKLRSLLGSGPSATRLALSGIDSDPVEYLRSVSGDASGHEILAILLDILHAGFVKIDEGTTEGSADELYVWPYFAVMPLESLTPPQQVELLRIVTAGDFEDMLAYGGYNFYRLAITPDGEWRYFMTGD